MALKESRIFTVGTFYGDKDKTTLNYCYTTVNRKGNLIWLTRVWCFWAKSKPKKVASRIKKLVANGMVLMQNVKQGQPVTTAQQMKLVDCGLLDPKQYEFHTIENLFKGKQK